MSICAIYTSNADLDKSVIKSLAGQTNVNESTHINTKVCTKSIRNICWVIYNLKMSIKLILPGC